MLEQKDSGTIGSVADFLAKELQIAQSTEEPDKAAGFVLVGNDTWLPKRLVSARKRQQRKVSRVAETGIVWTR